MTNENKDRRYVDLRIRATVVIQPGHMIGSEEETPTTVLALVLADRVNASYTSRDCCIGTKLPDTVLFSSSSFSVTKKQRSMVLAPCHLACQPIHPVAPLRQNEGSQRVLNETKAKQLGLARTRTGDLSQFTAVAVPKRES